MQTWYGGKTKSPWRAFQEGVGAVIMRALPKEQRDRYKISPKGWVTWFKSVHRETMTQSTANRYTKAKTDSMQETAKTAAQQGRNTQQHTRRHLSNLCPLCGLEKDTWAHAPLRCSHEVIKKLRCQRHNDGLEMCMTELETAQGGCFLIADLPGWRWLERTPIREIANTSTDTKTNLAEPSTEETKKLLRKQTSDIFKARGWIVPDYDNSDGEDSDFEPRAGTRQDQRASPSWIQIAAVRGKRGD